MRFRVLIAAVAAGVMLLCALATGVQAADSVVNALRKGSVYVEPGTGVRLSQVARLRAEARRLTRLGFPTKFGVLAQPWPTAYIDYSARVRALVGRRWNIALVWVAPRAATSPEATFAYAFDSPAPHQIETRVRRQALLAQQAQARGAIAFSIDLASRLSWYQTPVTLPSGGRLLQLDSDPELERLVKMPAAVPFPSNAFAGYQFRGHRRRRSPPHWNSR